MEVQSEKNFRRIRQKCLPLLLAFFLAAGMAQPALASSGSSQKTIKVLLVGNSYSYKNDLAGMLEKIGKSRNVQLSVKTIAKGKTSLANYANSKSTLGKRLRETLASEEWDYVILQDKRYLALKHASEMQTTITKLCKLIRNAGAKPMLYMTWAPLEGHNDYKLYASILSSKEEYQEKVAAVYTKIGKKTGAQVIPAGLAVLQAETKFPNLKFKASDKHHPNKKGSYVVACTMFSVLTGKSPYSSSTYTAGISKKTAMQLQKLAWKTVSEYKSKKK